MPSTQAISPRCLVPHDVSVVGFESPQGPSEIALGKTLSRCRGFNDVPLNQWTMMMKLIRYYPLVMSKWHKMASYCQNSY